MTSNKIDRTVRYDLITLQMKHANMVTYSLTRATISYVSRQVYVYVTLRILPSFFINDIKRKRKLCYALNNLNIVNDIVTILIVI